MATVLKKDTNTILQERLRYIASKAPIGKVKDGKVILDRNNPQDVEWYEIDKYKGK
ncbi:MAG: hypothetical protein Q8O09_02835 [Bacillota bacterium]|nr:hypothetical protein [Bacillota bacterium]